ncbi:uncharacterized protein [Eurosta solidaginis]|uniref:uncharacterized protein n=1 Tax=Eurosta solidaginis TaxID=178769 RepID=UPI0035309692
MDKKEVLKKCLLAYSSNMNSFQRLLSCFDIKIALLKRRRRRNLLIMQKLRQEQLLILTVLQQSANKRSLWKLKRESVFWEEQCQHNGDEFFKKHFHMNRASFDILCSFMKGFKRADTNYRTAIPLQKRVAISLFGLCSNEKYKAVSNLFGVGVSTAGLLLLEFCQEVWKIMSKRYINKLPPTQETLTECLEGFQRFGIPQCLGVIDTCHLEVVPLAHLATEYMNVDCWYSIILLALVDYRLRFLYMNVGASGACAPLDIYDSSLLKELLSEDEILLANKKQLDGDGIEIPVCIVGDSTFKLSPTLMKPYDSTNIPLKKEQEFFNTKLTECRKALSERAFNQLKARFRRIAYSIDNRRRNAPLIVRACCVLHNFLIERHDDFEEVWLQEVQNSITLKKSPKIEIDDTDDNVTGESISAELIRQALCNYICSSVSSHLLKCSPISFDT